MLSLQYAGKDLIENSTAYKFDVLTDPPKWDEPWKPCPCTWQFECTIPGGGLPSKGDIKLACHFEGPYDDFFAEGTAQVSKKLIGEDNTEYVITPVTAPLRFPDEEKRQANIKTDKEKV